MRTASHLSHHLGRALQLTNILRDLDEDAEIGRLYLPREYLEAAGITTDDPQAALANPNLGSGLRAADRAGRASISARPARSWIGSPAQA